MKNIIKRIGIVAGILIGLFALYFIIVIIVAMVTKYKPEPIEKIDITKGTTNTAVALGEEYTIITYNTGYAGLDETQDFFMDGGKNAGGGSKAEVEENLAGITTYLDENPADFLILQEVDESGKRSFNVNQKASYEGRGKYTAFGINYNLKYLPIPIFDPMGGAVSGIMTLSDAKPISSERYTFDGKLSYIVGLFELDRCFTVTRYELENGKEFVLVNAHFSAFDKGGVIREQQLAHIKGFLADESEKGNYVLLGGDFNHELPGTAFEKYTDASKVPYPKWCVKMPDDFAPDGFHWGVDPDHPTCRSNNIPLREGENALVGIDGFLASDNIKIVSTAVSSEEGFRYSDHNPVIMKFILEEEEDKD